MTVGRDRIDRVIDLFVAVPICSAVAVRRATPIVFSSLRRAVSHSIPVAVGASRSSSTDGTPATSHDPQRSGVTEGSPETGRSEPEPVPSGPAADLPIADYDHLAARQILDRLDSLDQAELASIEVYEMQHRHRRTVLSRLQQLGA
jgi:hypothetical protein